MPLGKVLVTGGAGCLGSHLVEVLHEKREELGVTGIVVLDLQENVKWASPKDNERIKGYCSQWVVGSILDSTVVARAIRGCDAVIHTASAVDTGTVPKELLYQVNVKGTETIIAACMYESSVKALVYCSSMDSVCSHTDFRDLDGPNEDQVLYAMDDPDVDCSHDVYSISKALGEKRTLRANGCLENPGLRTGVIRPVGLYGERDTVHLGIVLETGKSMGRMMLFQVGDGSAMFQHVYARNCAWMHALLAKKLVEKDEKVTGQVFFGIDNTKVTNFFYFFRPYLAMKGYGLPSVGIPEWLLYPFFAFAEDMFLFVRAIAPNLVKGIQPKLSRRAIQGSCMTAWFYTDKAKRLLGYEPLCSPMEARERSLEFFKSNLLNEFPQGPYRYNERCMEEINYRDDGKDYRPDDPKYLKRHEENQEVLKRTGRRYNRSPLKRTCVYLLLGATVSVIVAKTFRA